MTEPVDPFAPGARHTTEFTLTAADIERFAEATGDRNPVHLDDEAGRAAGFAGRLAHGMLTASVFSRVLGTTFPGPGTIYLGQTLRFLAPVYPGVALTATVEVTGRERRRATLRTTVATDDGTLVVDGEAEVLLPKGG
jgi:3-hydroxybutyryl-CoA dehydratase